MWEDFEGGVYLNQHFEGYKNLRYGEISRKLIQFSLILCTMHAHDIISLLHVWPSQTNIADEIDECESSRPNRTRDCDANDEHLSTGIVLLSLIVHACQCPPKTKGKAYWEVMSWMDPETTSKLLAPPHFHVMKNQYRRHIGLRSQVCWEEYCNRLNQCFFSP